MAKIDKIYRDLLLEIIGQGFTYEDPNRKGVNRIQIPSYKIEYNFSDGFPAVTTKKLYWKGVVGELIWFLRGDTNIKYLVNNNINIWNKDAYNYYKKICKTNSILSVNFDQWLSSIKSGMVWKDNMPNDYKLGDLGPVYGHQWRRFEGYEPGTGTWEEGIFYSVDQIDTLITGLKENPMGTEHIVSAWNPAKLRNMALPPCHWSFEVLVEPMSIQERINNSNCVITTNLKSDKEWLEVLDKYNAPKHKFTLKWHQRSTDTFLGLPFNIASYALLAYIIGNTVNMIPKAIEGDLSNVHIYEPHLEAAKEQLERDTSKYSNCNLNIAEDIPWRFSLNGIVNGLEIEDFKLRDYNSYPAIKADMLAYNK